MHDLRTSLSSTPVILSDWLRRANPNSGVQLIHRGKTTFYTWPQVLADVDEVTARLSASGVEAGDRVGIRAANSYEWLVLDLALITLGARVVAIPPTDFKGRDNSDLMTEFDLSMMFAGKPDRGQGTEAAALESILEPGPLPAKRLTAHSANRQPADPRDYFSVAFSSGTSGRVKRLLMYWPGVEELIRLTAVAFEITPRDRILVALPLATFQQRYLCYLAMYTGCSIVLTTVTQYLFALERARPTILLGPPSFYQMAVDRFASLPVHEREQLLDEAARIQELPASVHAERLRSTFREFHDLFGGSARVMLVGSAPVGPDMLDFFDLAGLPLYQLYGMTESGFLTWNLPGSNCKGSAGIEVHPGSISIADDGEVLVTHRYHICVGYENESEADARAVFPGVDRVATGDIGDLVDGHLVISGRKKNVITTVGGKKTSIEELEQSLRRMTNANEVAYIPGSPDRAGRAVVVWSSGDPAAIETALRQCIDMVNRELSPDSKITSYTVVAEALAPDSPLRNRNLKVDRVAVRARYEKVLTCIG